MAEVKLGRELLYDGDIMIRDMKARNMYWAERRWWITMAKGKPKESYRNMSRKFMAWFLDHLPHQL